MATRQPLIVIVGPTASGKTALAIQVAKKHDGEIICADSRTVFREMDIGTAKPSVSEQDGIAHWGLDLAAPGDRFTAAAFQDYAKKYIEGICARGKIPIVVGGTGLYIDGLIFDYDFPAEATPEQRAKFESMDSSELYEYCIENGTELPINDKNKRHLVRAALSAGLDYGRRETIISETYVFGLAVAKPVLLERMRSRSVQMFEAGVVEEAKVLGDKYGWDSEAMTGNIYPLIRRYLDGRVTKGQVINKFEERDWQLAKRQMTWFRRNPFIVWGGADDIVSNIEHLFTSEQ